MIGTNDVNNGGSVSDIVNDLSELIDKIHQESPDTYLLVSSIPPLAIDREGGSASETQVAEDYNQQIPLLVNQKAAEGKRVFFADAGGQLSLSDLNDGVHPTVAGYNQLGDLWYDELIQRDALDNVTQFIASSHDDRITSGPGQDELTGAGGSDTFIYLSPEDGIDTILDFGSDDQLLVSAAGFGGGLAAGVPLSATDSATGVLVSDIDPQPLGTSATFLFEQQSHYLMFDVDGTGVASPVILAHLPMLSNLSLSQIEVVQ
jgi:Ca2+-binding RTX toxin-like protein